MSGLRSQMVKLLSLPWMRPISAPLAWLYAGRSTSLMYHRILPGRVDTARTKTSHFHPNLILSVAEERFDEQMRHVRAHHECLPLADAVAALKQGELPRGSVTVTFDDGYLDNLDVALPVLERHGVPATIYVTTGLIDRKMILWWDELEHILRNATALEFDWLGHRHVYPLDGDGARWAAFGSIAPLFKQAASSERARLMELLRPQARSSFSYDGDVLTWDQVRELDGHPLITIAAHTVDHPALLHSSEGEARDEMALSRERLERELGHPVAHFAYPFGGRAEAGPREFGICGSVGFESAVTTRAGHWHASHRGHPYALPRIMVEYFDDEEAFRFKLGGLDAFLQQKGRRFVTA